METGSAGGGHIPPLRWLRNACRAGNCNACHAAKTKVSRAGIHRFLGGAAGSAHAAPQSPEALWQWGSDEIAASGAFRPDQSDCGYCRFDGICRKREADAAAAYGG